MVVLTCLLNCLYHGLMACFHTAKCVLTKGEWGMACCAVALYLVDIGSCTRNYKKEVESGTMRD